MSATSPDPAELTARASALFRAGRVLEAIPAYEALVAARDDLPNSWFNLAHLRRKAGRHEAALQAYARALALGITGPEEVHLERALVYSDGLARPEEARAELVQAVALNPDYVPALLNLGNLHEDLGEAGPAADTYRRVLAIEPGHPLALARLAGVARPRDAGDPLLGQLRATLGRRDVALEDKVTTAFALGAALDGVGAYDEAFAVYGDANRAARALAAQQGQRYDPSAQAQLVDALIRAFPEPVAASDDELEPAPIFICGLFRSGSTLAEQIIARHSAVTAGGELDLVPRLVAERFQPYPAAAAMGEVESARRWYLNQVSQRHPGARLVTDKRPDNFLHIGLIKHLFPAAKIIHTTRDLLDNGLSLFFLNLDPAMAYATDLTDIGDWVRHFRHLMAHWRRLYPDDIFDLDYDALVADPLPQLDALQRFLGLAPEALPLEPSAADGPVRTASVWQVRQPLYRRASGRWRNYAAHLAPLRAALAE